jgi:hypothetical protein
MATVPRAKVLAYRERVHGLARTTPRAADLEVFDLGVQDTPAGSARLALGARLDDPAAARVVEDDDQTFVEVWSVRGAPHFIRRRDASAMAAALRPWSDADAEARLAGFGVTVRRQQLGGLDVLDQAISAVHASLKESPMTKGELSGAVTKRLHEPLVAWCRSCNVTHITDPLFRLATLAGGARIVPNRKPLTFVRLEGVVKPTTRRRGTDNFLRTYLRLNGPASFADAAGFLATTATEIKGVWPEGLTKVSVDRRACFIPQEDAEDLASAEHSSIARLLPPSDPILVARDRELLVPDRKQRAALWTNLGRRGGLWADGEIRGMWQVRGTRRADFKVTAFSRLNKTTKGRVDTEAERVADLRGAADFKLVFDA